MKIIGLFIIIASLQSDDGTYRYAARDTCGKTYHLMMMEHKNVGDTLKFN